MLYKGVAKRGAGSGAKAFSRLNLHSFQSNNNRAKTASLNKRGNCNDRGNSGAKMSSILRMRNYSSMESLNDSSKDPKYQQQ